MARVFRQGDVIVREVQQWNLPRYATSLTEVVIEGETGNAHRLVGKYEAMAFGSTIYVRAAEECVLEHPEHAPVRIPPGTYVLHRVREFDRLEMIRNNTLRHREASD
ncbi:MAG: hypothetical protein QXP81_09455 [Nitrososphaerota archaeon]